MAALLSAVTANTTGTGAAVTGPTTVHFAGSFGGGKAFIRIATADTAALYKVVHTASAQYPAPVVINATGAYWIRADLVDVTNTTAIVASPLTVTEVQ